MWGVWKGVGGGALGCRPGSHASACVSPPLFVAFPAGFPAPRKKQKNKTKKEKKRKAREAL